MKILLVLTFIFVFGSLVSAQTSAAKPITGSAVVADKGWGEVALLTDKTVVEKILGAGTLQTGTKVRPETYLYPSYGITIEYWDNRVYNLIFKNQNTEKYRFTGKLEKDLKWGASKNEVIAAYGKPRYSDDKQNFIEYKITKSSRTKFKFEGDKLVEIEIIYDGAIFV